MKYFYDLHIHSALSPCGDEDMTPNNIVNMAKLKGLQIIAVSDHNTIGNLEAVMKCAETENLTVIPAMEVETAEEVHVLCLFPTLSDARIMADIVYDKLLNIKNDPEIFGRQIYLNHEDEKVGEEEKLLICATSLSIEDVKALAEENNGIAVPAHVDRTSYSIISNLGFIPPIGFTAAEVADKNRIADFEKEDMVVISNSDAHYLGDISEAENFIELDECTAASLIKKLKKK